MCAPYAVVQRLQKYELLGLLNVRVMLNDGRYRFVIAKMPGTDWQLCARRDVTTSVSGVLGALALRSIGMYFRRRKCLLTRTSL